MRKVYPLVTLLLIFVFSSLALGREARLVRYPSYNNGRIAFTYLGDIWTADENGGNVQRLTVNKARDAYPRFSPDGKRIAYNPKGQVYWRKYYRGAYATDVWIEDIAAKKFTQLTDFDGLDSWPMWSSGGDIYFVSDRDGGGLTNIWRVSDNGGKADRVTSFKSGDVRFPSISADGRTIVFEHDFGIWKLDTGSKKATAIHLNIDAE